MKFIKPSIRDIIFFLLPIGIVVSFLITMLLPIGMNIAINRNRPEVVLKYMDVTWSMMVVGPIFAFISLIGWNSIFNLSLPISNIMLTHLGLTGFALCWLSYIGEQATFAHFTKE